MSFYVEKSVSSTDTANSFLQKVYLYMYACTPAPCIKR